jgi:uncharacterized protein
VRFIFDVQFVSKRTRTRKDKDMPEPKYAAYQGAEPYFSLIRTALGDRVDGEHFFDVVADHVIFEVRYDLGWPRVIEGRAGLMTAFANYVEHIALESADRLATHRTDDGCIVEYDVHGTILASGVAYHNRFCSIIKIADRKITHWRDYMDSLAAWHALTAKRED